MLTSIDQTGITFPVIISGTTVCSSCPLVGYVRSCLLFLSLSSLSRHEKVRRRASAMYRLLRGLICSKSNRFVQLVLRGFRKRGPPLLQPYLIIVKKHTHFCRGFVVECRAVIK